MTQRFACLLLTLAFLATACSDGETEAPDAEAVFDMEEVEVYKEYREIVQPCTLEVGEGERSGTLTCPELATEDGETVAMTVHWEPAG